MKCVQRLDGSGCYNLALLRRIDQFVIRLIMRESRICALFFDSNYRRVLGYNLDKCYSYEVYSITYDPVIISLNCSSIVEKPAEPISIHILWISLAISRKFTYLLDS